jgi:O-antigen ligase
MRWRQKIAMNALTLLILASSVITGILLHEQLVPRIGTIHSQERFFYQNVAVKMIQNHPFLGVGYHQFASQINDYLPEKSSYASCVHNIFLLIASETGLLSLAGFLCWAGLLIYRGWRFRNSSPETALLWSLFIAFLFIGCCDYYLIFMQQGRLLFFGLAGLLARFGCTENDQNKQLAKTV